MRSGFVKARAFLYEGKRLGAERINREETRALLGKGKEAWNAWALGIFERKKTLEDTGSWSADWFGEGQNPEKTVAWLDEARSDFAAVEFAAEVNFDGFVFPGPADFSGAHLVGRVVFANVHFASPAQFEKARFDGDADFTGAKFYDLANFDDVVFALDRRFREGRIPPRDHRPPCAFRAFPENALRRAQRFSLVHLRRYRRIHARFLQRQRPVRRGRFPLRRQFRRRTIRGHRRPRQDAHPGVGQIQSGEASGGDAGQRS